VFLQGRVLHPVGGAAPDTLALAEEAAEFQRLVVDHASSLENTSVQHRQSSRIVVRAHPWQQRARPPAPAAV
jgi:hypothetical protein